VHVRIARACIPLLPPPVQIKSSLLRVAAACAATATSAGNSTAATTPSTLLWFWLLRQGTLRAFHAPDAANFRKTSHECTHFWICLKSRQMIQVCSWQHTKVSSFSDPATRHQNVFKAMVGRINRFGKIQQRGSS
jgi:hypothetical protein